MSNQHTSQPHSPAGWEWQDDIGRQVASTEYELDMHIAMQSNRVHCPVNQEFLDIIKECK